MKGLALASDLYHNRQLKVWVEVRRKREPTQLHFVDAVSDRYRVVVHALSRQQRMIIEHILTSYHRGISPGEIAKRGFASEQAVAHQVRLLCNSGLVFRKPHPTDKRSSRYFVTDEDFLRVAAVFYDPAWIPFLEANRHRVNEGIVDEFIEKRSGRTTE